MDNIFDRYSKRYDAWYDKNKYAYLSELRALKSVIPAKGKGLEIGVGTGRFAAPLGIETGIDPSEEMLKIAKSRGVDAHLGVGEALPFKNSTFDYVAIIIALCFVKDPNKVIVESRRVLKRDGKIIIGIIDKDSFLGKLYTTKKSVFYKEAKFFGPKEVFGMLKSLGFDGLSYIQTLFQDPGHIKAVDKPRKGCGAGGFVIVSGKKN